MHQIWKELVHHVKDDYTPRSYLLTGLLLTLLLLGNYYFEFKNDLFKGISNWSYLWFNGAVFYLSYYGAVLIKSGTAPFKNKDFLISSFSIIAIATLSSSLLFARDWVSGFSQMEQYYLMRILFNSLGSIVVFVGLGILFYVHDKGKVDGFYGLSIRKKHNYLPYFGLLLLMLPLLIWASSQAHFLDTYPMFKANRYQSVFGLSLQQMTAIFEGFYLLDFIRVELIFSGRLDHWSIALSRKGCGAAHGCDLLHVAHQQTPRRSHQQHFWRIPARGNCPLPTTHYRWVHRTHGHCWSDGALGLYGFLLTYPISYLREVGL